VDSEKFKLSDQDKVRQTDSSRYTMSMVFVDQT